MWLLFQSAIMIAVGFWLVSIGETHGRAIGILCLLVALVATLAINGLVLGTAKVRAWLAWKKAKPEAPSLPCSYVDEDPEYRLPWLRATDHEALHWRVPPDWR